MWIEDEDKWVWSMESSGSFSVKSVLRSANVANPSAPPICNFAWNNKVPPRIQFFVWTTLKKRILVRHNLSRRGFLFEEVTTIYPLCEDEEETVDHLLCKCQFTWVVWYPFLRLFGCSRVIGSGAEDLIVAWMGGSFRSRHRVACKMIPFVISWAIWGERNRRIF